jgi:hypothetical protein
MPIFPLPALTLSLEVFFGCFNMLHWDVNLRFLAFLNLNVRLLN